MKILFICTGNTCRSCMAEVIFNQLCNINEFEACSAGVRIVPGSITSKNSSKLLLDKLNCDISVRKAVQLDQKFAETSDLILAMSNSVKQYAIKNFEADKNKTFTLNEYVEVEGEVSDPYGGNLSVYWNTFDQIEHLIKLLLLKLKEGNRI